MSTQRFSLRSLYLYVVCFASLLIAVFAMVNLVRAGIELLYPDPGSVYYVPDKSLSPQDQAAQVEAYRASAVRQSVISLATSATTLLLAVPIYVYHWGRVRREQGNETHDVTPSSPSAA